MCHRVLCPPIRERWRRPRSERLLRDLLKGGGRRRFPRAGNLFPVPIRGNLGRTGRNPALSIVFLRSLIWHWLCFVRR